MGTQSWTQGVGETTKDYHGGDIALLWVAKAPLLVYHLGVQVCIL